MSDIDVMEPILKDDSEIRNQEPKLFSVIFLNDDFTTIEFVVDMFIKYHSKTYEEAQKLATEVHEKGKAIAGVYTREIAETKVFMVNQRSKLNNYPFRNIMQEN